MTNIEVEYEAAIAVSRHALEQFNAEPQRGLNGWQCHNGYRGDTTAAPIRSER